MTTDLSVMLIRHGESEANRRNVLVSYSGDPGLTNTGWNEARQLASEWMEESITAVYSSPLLRARQTAAAFAEGRPELAVQIDQRLHEIGLGNWDGRAIPEIEKTDGEHYQLWKADPETGIPDGGEPLSAVGARVASFLADMQARYAAGLVIAVSHADCLKAACLQALDAPWTAAQWLHLTNASGIYLAWRKSRWQVMIYPPSPLGRLGR